MYSVRHPARRYDREYIAYPISVFSLCVAGLICRCGSGGRHGGFCFFSFPAVSMISRPHPPAPLPPPGKGESQSLFRRGLRPRHPCTESPTALTDAAVQVPGGWFARQVAGSPCLELYWLPPSPPAPLPVGKGAFSFLMQGASPLASPGAESMVCCKPDRKQFPASGAARVQPPGTTAAKSISAANGLMPGCRGRSPRRNKLIVSPFPAGEGGRGDRGQNQN